LLHKDPACRPTIRDVLKNPFFWTETQKMDHIRYILTGPKSTAIEQKSARMLIPSCGHFGELPKILAVAHDADSGPEAIDALSNVYDAESDGAKGFTEAILTHLPILLPLTSKFAQHNDDDVCDSESSAKIGEVELEFDFDE
jgi:hypothetical protein